MHAILPSFLALILPVLLVSGFGGSLQRHSRRGRRETNFLDTTTHRREIMMAAASSTTTTTTTASVPNWRVLKKPSKDVRSEASEILGQREAWSDENYQDALQLHEQLMSCKDSYIAGPIAAALKSLDHAYRLYGPDSVVCSFNGGKDAVVILHLVRAAHAQYCAEAAIACTSRPRVVYWDHADEFPEILSFLKENVERYDLDMIAFEEGVKFADGLSVLVENNLPAGSQVPFPMAFVLGTRTTDPNAGQQKEFSPSSHYMPPFMRVNPVLEWSYGHVWHFLRLNHLPYCKLYDQGYTSLGTVKDTLPCPALAVVGGSSSVPKYWPAYMLRDYDQERAGRIPKEKLLKKKASTKKNAAVDDSESSATLSRANSSIGHLSTMSEVGPVPSQNADDSDLSVEAVEDVNISCISFGSDTVATQKTVGVLIIGDEILKGLTADTNTQVAAKALREHNVFLQRVVVVSDIQEEIAKEISRLQQEVDVIITSGGVGPTHDDVTIKSVAAALSCEMVLHNEMAQLLRDKMNDGDDKDAELSDAQIKMATLPSKSKLRYMSDNPKDWPVLQCENIFILPGVPEFFSNKIENVASYLSCQLERGTAYKVVLSVDENSIVPILNQVVENHPNVSIGSYPFVNQQDYKTIITVEGRLQLGGRSNSVIFDRDMIDQSAAGQMEKHIQLALDELITELPAGSVLRVDNDDLVFS